MITALVHINVQRTALTETVLALLAMPEVASVYSVTGEYDLVALLQVERIEEVADIVTVRIAGLREITRTETHFAFKEYRNAKSTASRPDHGSSTHDEFDQPVFVAFYEAISDTFIDTKGAAASLERLVPKGSSVFELGMGTGYFAHFLQDDGYDISGIEPSDEMLRRLKAEYPGIEVVAEQLLEVYEFDDTYDAIISHSSVFLFTRTSEQEAHELGTPLIFQSFIQHGSEAFRNIDKAMHALRPGGGLYINIQPNAQPRARINDDLTFEMLSCKYDFGRSAVEKVFAITENGICDVSFDPSYVQKWQDFQRSIAESGYQASISEDGYWVVIKGRETVTASC